MKSFKLFVTAIFIILGICSVKAQSTEIDFGIKAGANLSNLNTGVDAVTGKWGKVGFNAGIFGRIGKAFYLQPELNYISFNDKFSYRATSYEVTFNQVNIPLSVGYKIINTAALIFRVSVGPDFYYNLKDPISPDGSKYKYFTLGKLINIGVDLGNLTLDARYSLGYNQFNEGLNQKSNLFSLDIGIKFQ